MNLVSLGRSHHTEIVCKRMKMQMKADPRNGGEGKRDHDDIAYLNLKSIHT